MKNQGSSEGMGFSQSGQWVYINNGAVQRKSPTFFISLASSFLNWVMLLLLYSNS